MTPDATQQPEAPAGAPGAPAKRDPVYAVFVRDNASAWVCMNESLRASSRQAAVLQACKDNNEAAREGDFMVVPADAIKHLTRKVKQTVIDEFA